jgi:hypothetical protein
MLAGCLGSPVGLIPKVKLLEGSGIVVSEVLNSLPATY